MWSLHGVDAHVTISRVAQKLSIQIHAPMYTIKASMYFRLGITLMYQNASTLLSHSGLSISRGDLTDSVLITKLFLFM